MDIEQCEIEIFDFSNIEGLLSCARQADQCPLPSQNLGLRKSARFKVINKQNTNPKKGPMRITWPFTPRLEPRCRRKREIKPGPLAQS